jgi:signal transduction histidine kinase
MKFGGALEVLLFSFGLGNRINAMREEKEREKIELRNRISADLHDEIGSNLGAVNILAKMLRTEPDLTQQTKKKIDDLAAISSAISEEMREIVWFINSDHGSLDALIRKMRFSAADLLNGIEHRIDESGCFTSRPADMIVCRNAYLIYKESLHNIAKHSHAMHVSISFSYLNECLSVSVTDNGVGFDAATPPRGAGLTNMRRRAEEINADLSIASSPNDGTSVQFTVSLHRKAA